MGPGHSGPHLATVLARLVRLVALKIDLGLVPIHQQWQEGTIVLFRLIPVYQLFN